MKLLTPLSLILSLALWGCSSVTMVDHTFDPEFDLSQYQTFNLLPNQHSELNKDAMTILGEDDFSLVAVRAVLEARGFDFVAFGVPDFMISVRVEMTGKPRTNVGKSPIIRSPWNDSEETQDAIVSELIEGRSSVLAAEGVVVSMLVEVFDTKTNKMVWEGWASAPSLSAFRGDDAKLRIVNQIMQRFPN